MRDGKSTEIVFEIFESAAWNWTIISILFPFRSNGKNEIFHIFTIHFIYSEKDVWKDCAIDIYFRSYKISLNVYIILIIME